MRAALPVLCLSFACGVSLPLASQAMGFGRVASSTLLGQPLDFSAAVRLEAGESLARECVFAEVTSGDARVPSGLVRVTLDGVAGDTDRTVRVTTSVPIDEPVVAISVTLGCTDRITRRFVAFVDPPGVNLAQSTSVDAAPAGPSAQAGPVPPAGRTRAERAGTGRQRPPGSDPAASRAAGSAGVTVAATDAGSRRASPPSSTELPDRRLVAPRRLAAGPRLQLEAPALVLAPKFAPASSAPTPAVPFAARQPVPVVATAAPASAPDHEADLLAEQRRRIASLEAEVQRLRSESRAQQQALLAVRAGKTLTAASRRSDRYATPSVLALALLALLGTVLVGGFLGRRSRDRAAARWARAMRPAPRVAERAVFVDGAVVSEAGPPTSRQPSDDMPDFPPEAPAQRTAPLAVMQGPTLRPAVQVVADLGVFRGPGALRAPDGSGAGSAAPAVRSGDNAAPGGSSARPPLDTPLPVVTDEVPRRPERNSSVEELIDLDQQVDFFIALGQDDAALDLLQQHAGDTGGAGPLPLLKMLELHRRLGDRAAHDRLRTRIDRDFNVVAPDWDADPAQGRPLDAYPGTLARLQSVWRSPVQAIALLDRAVLRRGAEDPAFDLPAYRELLLLHSIAQDHVMRGETETAAEPLGEVDLLLPLDAVDEAPISRLSARPAGDPDFANSELLTAPLDLDVSFETSTAPPPRPASRLDIAETVPAALRRPPDYANESAFVDFEIDLPAPGSPGRRA